jgi:hypothetical protein
MTISLFRRTSVHGTGDSAHRPGPRHARVATEPVTNSLPSTLGGLRRLENGLRKVLPQPLTHSLFGRLAPLPSANESPADSARSRHEDAGVGRAPADNHYAHFSSPPGPDLVELAGALVGFENETVRYIEIESILDKCETGRAAMNDDLAHAVFQAIASLQDTPRDALLERALSIICRDPQLSVSAQALLNDQWFPDENLAVFRHMRAAVEASEDTPERAEWLATLAALLNRLPPSVHDEAAAQVIEAIARTDIMGNRWASLVQLQMHADRQWHDGPERGELLRAIEQLGGKALRTLQHVG